MKSKGFVLIALVGLFLCLVGLPAWADKGDKHVQFGLVYSTPTNDLQDGSETIEAQDATGFQASFEFLVADRVGVEPAITWANHDIKDMEQGFPTITIGDADLRTVTANVNFHVTPGSKADVFVGPTVGYTFWGDLNSPMLGGTFSIDDDFIYGANVGVNVPFGSGNWSFAAALNYLVLDAALADAAPGEAALDVDPLQLKVGAAYRF